MVDAVRTVAPTAAGQSCAPTQPLTMPLPVNAKRAAMYPTANAGAEARADKEGDPCGAINGSSMNIITPTIASTPDARTPDSLADFLAQTKMQACRTPAARASNQPDQGVLAWPSGAPKMNGGLATRTAPSSDAPRARPCGGRRRSPRKAWPSKPARTMLMLVRDATSPGAAPACTASTAAMSTPLLKTERSSSHLRPVHAGFLPRTTTKQPASSNASSIRLAALSWK
mmetsp:Transcript_65679/g.186383  ORF Transcript_65679/g.186383 Transcript_65679/m.186383 type:complete len:228 (-) Transcript_65679:203-886(-)